MAEAKLTAATVRLEKTDGTVKVTAGGANQTVQAGMRLTDGYAVKSEAKSVCYISLDGNRAVKVCASSEVKVTKSGNRLELVKVSGTIEENAAVPSGSFATSSDVTGVRG